DHLLILPVRLYVIPERVRTERIAGVFCEMIAEDEDLRAWLREVDAPPPRTGPPPPRRPPPAEWSPPRPSEARSGAPRIVLRQPPAPTPAETARAETPAPIEAAAPPRAPV